MEYSFGISIAGLKLTVFQKMNFFPGKAEVPGQGKGREGISVIVLLVTLPGNLQRENSVAATSR